MFAGTSGSSLTSSSHLLAATWENALGHYRRALLECGSPLDVEHSQRLGLLFSHNVGDSGEVKRWASLFDAEDVPTTALLLKALVKHGQWQTAVGLLDLNKERSAARELCDVLGQCLVASGLWQQTLQLAHLLRKRVEDSGTEPGVSLTSGTPPPLSRRVVDESLEMATNPAFLPEEERTTYSGFVSAIARAFPVRAQWKEAVRLLRELEPVVDAETERKLLEYEIARLVHDAHAYEEVIDRGRREQAFLTSPSLLRSLLRAAVATKDVRLTIDSLVRLGALDTLALSSKIFESACTLLLSSEVLWAREDLARFETVVCRQAFLVQDRHLQKLLSAFCADYELRLPVFLASVSTAVGPGSPSPSRVPDASITQLDRLATKLVSQRRWEEALQVASRIRETAALNDHERIIAGMLHGGSSSWKKTLQFFAS
ncbi:hypothetical protein NESM_000394400 [Novymonas esmeraldas]|uniref:Uncharacterized protein n=1 Tax=Novymonas esmeraldas TaxID=1808958 RepID=A0AAW0ENE4_9TRYP